MTGMIWKKESRMAGCFFPESAYLMKQVEKLIDIISGSTYNNRIRQATACACQSVEVRECAGRHCLMELARGVV